MTSNDMEYLTIALPKGKLFSLSSDLLAKVGYTAEGLTEKSRKLVIVNEEKKIKMEIFIILMGIGIMQQNAFKKQ